jgi:hypothetical protein
MIGVINHTLEDVWTMDQKKENPAANTAEDRAAHRDQNGFGMNDCGKKETKAKKIQDREPRFPADDAPRHFPERAETNEEDPLKPFRNLFPTEPASKDSRTESRPTSAGRPTGETRPAGQAQTLRIVNKRTVSALAIVLTAVGVAASAWSFTSDSLTPPVNGSPALPRNNTSAAPESVSSATDPDQPPAANHSLEPAKPSENKGAAMNSAIEKPPWTEATKSKPSSSAGENDRDRNGNNKTSGERKASSAPKTGSSTSKPNPPTASEPEITRSVKIFGGETVKTSAPLALTTDYLLGMYIKNHGTTPIYWELDDRNAHTANMKGTLQHLQVINRRMQKPPAKYVLYLYCGSPDQPQTNCRADGMLSSWRIIE